MCRMERTGTALLAFILVGVYAAEDGDVQFKRVQAMQDHKRMKSKQSKLFGWGPIGAYINAYMLR